MIFKEKQSIKGNLAIYKKEGNIITKIHDDSNVIADVFRENLASIFETGEGVPKIKPVKFQFDDGGSSELFDGTELVRRPSPEERVNTASFHFLEKEIESISREIAPNIVKLTCHIPNEMGNGKELSRAMLVSEDGSPIAIKCFESIIKKEDWELLFDWRIAF